MYQVHLHLGARTSITLAASQWRAYIRRYTERTRGHYKGVMHQFLTSLPALTVDQLKPYHISSYVNNLLIERKNRTANAHLTVLKSFCRWLAVNYDIPNVAKEIPMLREDPPEQRFLTHEEYLKALAVCNKREADVIQALANTGMRASEICNLSWDCVNLEMTAITITGKGRKRRTIPLNQTCRQILKKYNRQPDTPIQFLKSVSKRQWLWCLCQRVSKRAGLKPFGPHALRHYCITRLLERGANINLVSRFAGHSSIRTTERIYYHPTDDLSGLTDVLDEI